MGYAVPVSLSPSRAEAFTACALAFRFAELDHLPEAASPHAIKGTLVHAALERLFALDAPARTRAAASGALGAAWHALSGRDAIDTLGLDDEGAAAFRTDAEALLDAYFALEDPAAVHAIGLELKLRAEIGGVPVSGVLDRLDRRPDGELVVVDYKTSRSPKAGFEQTRHLGVDTYALLCEAVLGRRPVAVRLLYLGDGVAITCRPSEERSRFTTRKLGAVWEAVTRLCGDGDEDFEPRPGWGCEWCSYRTWCPVFDGDPEAARAFGAGLATTVPGRGSDRTEAAPAPAR